MGFMDYYEWLFDKTNDSLYYAKQSPMSLIAQGMGLMQNVTYKYPLVIDKRAGQATVQVKNIQTYEPKSVIRKICFLFVIFLLFLQQKSSAKQYN